MYRIAEHYEVIVNGKRYAVHYGRDVAEHYEVIINGKRYAVHYGRDVAERIAKEHGGTVRVIPAHTIGENL